MTLLHYTPPTSPYLEIVYQDEALVVVNKPSGLLSVPGKDPAHRDSVWWRVTRVFPDARVVHRLDMATSGLIVLALGKAAQAHLQRQFERRVVRKHYRAVVAGHLPAQRGVIDLPMRCDWPNRPRQMIDLMAGKHAQTRYQVISTSDATTEVLLFPITGRSHQLRVHMQLLGTPILGDKFYADAAAYAAAPRLLLHAEEIGFEHPLSGQAINFHCPADF
ncbi:pseudouridine synthase [Pseudidiomarina insulisalsae]|uniref:Dual-specificity RNA pseudouridine synthase RluA n=1 Tax=Pseudidiomarina insulisalsae TaxID=575789 RepID=A0A432YA97_9GAMM|nr:pseudouridine synthase [Pseudidiomarina insulisalsae]RUO57831.1 RNA pseudouridine synthase [Pseudidiomarina insulisalsae]